ncbi:MAG: metallopeptidase family protein [bacterium]|nr:metallopeptidase family protein [bacterium]
MRVSHDEFEALVTRALDQLPREFAELLDNVAVVIEEEPGPEELDECWDPDDGELLGLYRGVPLIDRGCDYVALPDQVVLYRGPLLRTCANRRELIREVRDTVIHELGHYFGLSDEEMPF